MEPRCSHTVQAGFSRHLEQHSCVEAVLSPFGAPRVPPLPTCAAVVIKCRNPRPGVTPVVAGHEPPAFGVALLCMYKSPSTCACAVAGRGGSAAFRTQVSESSSRLTFTPRCREPTFSFERKGITLSYVGMGRPEEQPPAPLIEAPAR